MAFELTPREFANGSIGGLDYGSSVRVLVRSPKAIVSTGLGLNLIYRPFISHRDHHKLTDERIKTSVLEGLKDRLDAAFEPGVGEAAVQAWKEGKTVLVDGGGEALGLPGVQLRAVAEAKYADRTINYKADLTGRIATCKQCGANLEPHTTHHHFDHKIQPDHPRSVADCQRIANQEVVAVHDYGMGRDHLAGYVNWFETWDGETTVKEDFCNDKCAALYGRRAAKSLPLLEVGGGIEETRRDFEAVRHYETEERFIDLGDGKRIKI